jgi:DNA-binding transcriptional LysR family regulator
LPPILAGLRLRHPDLAIELVASNAPEDLLRRDADVAVRMFDPVQTALVARRIGVVELGFHAAADYLDRRGVPASLAALSDFDLIGYDVETPALRAFMSRYPDLGRPGFALRCDSDVAQLAAIRAGFGIGVCQVGLSGNPALKRLLADDFAPRLPVWLVMHEDLRTSPRCRATFDAIADGLTAQLNTPATASSM